MMHGLVAGGPPVGPGGIFSLRDPSELAALAKRQGFVEVNVEEIPITSHADSIDLTVGLQGVDHGDEAVDDRLGPFRRPKPMLARDQTVVHGQRQQLGAAQVDADRAGHVPEA